MNDITFLLFTTQKYSSFNPPTFQSEPSSFSQTQFQPAVLGLREEKFKIEFLTLGTTFEQFCHSHSCLDKLPLTPHHKLLISNLILSINKKIYSGMSKWRVVVGAKQMVPMACPAMALALGTRSTTLAQNGWVLWFTWDFICTTFKYTVC